MTGAAQHERGVAECASSPLQAIRVRHAAMVEGDFAVLHDLQRDLVLDLLDAESWRRLVLDDETPDLVVSHVTRPDDREVTPRRVADPALLAVEDPGVAVARRGGREAASGAGAHERLGKGEAADLLHARHRRQPFLLLLVGAVEVDGIHGEAAVDAVEGT